VDSVYGYVIMALHNRELHARNDDNDHGIAVAFARVRPVHSMSVEQRQASANPQTKPTLRPSQPALRVCC